MYDNGLHLFGCCVDTSIRQTVECKMIVHSSPQNCFAWFTNFSHNISALSEKLLGQDFVAAERDYFR